MNEKTNAAARANELDELRARLRQAETRARENEARYRSALEAVDRMQEGLRRSEERYALATSAAVEGIYEWDLEANTLFLTERAKSFFSITGDELTPAAWNVRIHAEDYPGYRSAIVEHFKGRTAHLEQEYRIADDRGAYRWVLDRGIGVRDERGRVVKLVGALSDIDARKHAEIELRRARDDAQRALERQTATAEILRVISRSPHDVQPVFETIVGSALKLCNAASTLVTTVDGDNLRLRAFANADAQTALAMQRRYPRHRGRSTAMARAIETASVVAIPDVFADAEYDVDNATPQFRSVLGIPLLRDGKPIGAIGVGRASAGAFPDEQVALLQTFADQAVIAIDNVRLFTELDTRNRALAEALEQQTATSELLKVIGRSAFDLDPVFATLVESAVRLCEAERGLIFRYDGSMLRFAAGRNVSEELRDFFHRNPLVLARDSASGRAAVDRATVHIHDVRNDADYRYGGRDVDPYRTVLAVPMLKGDQLLGTITIYRHEVRPFRDSQVTLMQTFADQAVIAIDNVRLFTELEARNRELTEALEQQTATSEILRVISESPTDVQPVFDAIAAAALKLCRAASGLVFIYDGAMIELAASANVKPEAAVAWRDAFPRPPSRDTAATRAVLTGSVVAIPDVLADADYAIGAMAAGTGFRSALAVPLIRDGQPIGAVGVGRPDPGGFPDKQIALLQTFADQAVIAIENGRLFNELQTRNRELIQALEQQTATGDILSVMSRSQTDAQPVFDTIAAAALKLCNASSALVTTFDGERVHLEALAKLRPEGADGIRKAFPRPPSRETGATRAILTGGTVEIPDVLDDPDYATSVQALAGDFRSILAIPLIRNGSPIGAISVGGPEPGPFPDKQKALLQTFADQAVIAIENVRLFTQLESRTDELTRSVRELRALGEVGQAVSSTLHLEHVLRTIVSRARELAGMDGGAIYEYDEARGQFHLHATDNLAGELVQLLRATPVPRGEGAIGTLAIAREPVQVRDILHDPGYQSRVRELLIRLGYRSLLAVPLLREQHLLGGLVVNRAAAGEFAPETIELLKTFATQSALAIHNARLYRELEAKSAQLESASRHKSEFLANMSHELRTPLNAIIGFSEVLGERMFGELNDKQDEYVRDILDSGRHLLSLINDILDLAKIEAGRMELEAAAFDLPAAIENTLTLVRERAARRGIALGHAIDARLRAICADERKVKQVLLNLLSNAIKFTPEGGRVDVRAALRDGAVEISVSDTGVGIAPEDHDAVFEEFRQVGGNAKKVEGTGLGLAISRKFVELHGGRIWVESTPGVGSTFTFTLPLRPAR